MWFRISIGIIIIIAIAVGGSFFSSYNNQQSEANSLESKINNDSANLKVIQNKNDQLESELEEISRDVEDVLKSIDEEAEILPERINSNDLLVNIFDIGKDNDVVLVPLKTTDWNSLKVGKNEYQVFKIELEISGTEDDLILFITQIQNESFSTLVIEKLTLLKELIEDVDDIDEDGDIEEEIFYHSGTINLAVYSK